MYRAESTVSLLAGLLLSALALTGCDGAENEPVTERSPPLVEAVEAWAGTLPLQETVSGVVRAHNQLTVRPEIAGTIVEVRVESGQAVERGQPLVRLDDEELKQQLRQAEAGVRLAEAATAEARARVAELDARLTRTRALAKDELISAQELDSQEAQLAALVASAELAAARVEQAAATAAERRSALARAVVRAPVSGRLGQRQAEVGMRVDPSDALFVVGNLDDVRVEVPLTEAMIERVQAGMPVILEPRAGEPIRAVLSRVSPFLAEDSFSTIGEIDVDNRSGRLRPGNFVNVRILYGESRRATLVPASAVWEDPTSGRSGIFVVEDADGLVPPGASTGDDPAVTDVARSIVLRPVRVLAEGGGTAGIDSVQEGEWVVVVGQHMLREQAKDESQGAAMRAVGRVRPAAWERVRHLQTLKREDLLAGFLDKQQKIAAALGAEIPESEDAVHRVLEAAGASPAGGGD